MLALSNAGCVYAWGENSNGQLGLNDTQCRYEPVLVEELQPYTVVQILAVDDKSYALTSDGAVYAWGFNSGGQLGLENDSPRVLKPEPMMRLKAAPVLKFVVRWQCSAKTVIGFVNVEGTVVMLEVVEVAGEDLQTPQAQVTCRSMTGETLACLNIDCFATTSTLRQAIAAEIDLPVCQVQLLLPDGTRLKDSSGEVWKAFDTCPIAAGISLDKKVFSGARKCKFRSLISYCL